MAKQLNDITLSLIVIGAIALLFLFKIITPFFSSAPSIPIEPQKSQTIEKLVLTTPEWRQRLTAEQYIVMREDGTEPAYSGAFVHFNEVGTYRCAGCNLPLFSSADKFDAKTGWASFTQPISPDNISYKIKGVWIWVKASVHCARCDSHLGEVYNSGRPPSGKYYSINSVALTFEPTKK